MAAFLERYGAVLNAERDAYFARSGGFKVGLSKVHHVIRHKYLMLTGARVVVQNSYWKASRLFRNYLQQMRTSSGHFQENAVGELSLQAPRDPADKLLTQFFSQLFDVMEKYDLNMHVIFLIIFYFM